MDGVSTNLALIFGTLLSSQGADASFVLTLAGFPPGASFVLALPTLSDLSDPISSVLSGPDCFRIRGLPALSDFIRIIFADLIGGFGDSDKESGGSVVFDILERDANPRPERERF
ncbi:hypothetical protein AB6O49_13025 [Streptomyces sp. SBR177]